MGDVTWMIPLAPEDLVPARLEQLRGVVAVGSLALDDVERDLWREWATRVLARRPFTDDDYETLRLLIGMRRVQDAAITAHGLARHENEAAFLSRIASEILDVRRCIMEKIGIWPSDDDED